MVNQQKGVQQDTANSAVVVNDHMYPRPKLSATELVDAPEERKKALFSSRIYSEYGMSTCLFLSLVLFTHSTLYIFNNAQNGTERNGTERPFRFTK